MKNTANAFQIILRLLGSRKATIPLAALLLLSFAGTALAQGTAFTYQGQLNSGGSPANGSYDFQFILFNVDQFGFPVGPTLTNAAVPVANGLFGATLDFGVGVFTGTNLWLDISVRTNGSGAFTELVPRQPVLPTPYAVFANTAGNVSGTVSAAQLGGAVASANLSGTYGNALTLNNAGNSFVGTFSGNGAGLTGLNPANLSAGTAAINISGNAATASSATSAATATAANTAGNFTGSLTGDVTGTQGATVVSTVGGVTAAKVASGANAANGASSAMTPNTLVQRDAAGNFAARTITATLAGNAATATTATNLLGNVADGQLSANMARLNGTNAWSGTNTFAGVTLATNVNNVFNGSFTGSGAGLTSLNAANVTGPLPASQLSGTLALAQLPGAVLTNNSSGATLSGTFGGDGSGLTNVRAATLAIPPGMALIPAGSFTMGDNLDGESDATPTNVTVSSFYMDVNLVSYSQWLSVYFWATNHGYAFDDAGSGKAANHPVQMVNWYDAVKWCNARSQQAGLTPVYSTFDKLLLRSVVYTAGDSNSVSVNWTGNGYRLPTEAEWEKAARGGLSGQRFPWRNVINESLANYSGDTTDYSYDLGPNGYNAAFASGAFPYTSPVGYFAANGYGLYDMAGNVLEWCWDWYGTSYAGGTDPRGPASGSARVIRGGCWHDGAFYCRSAFRNYGTPSRRYDFIGFRSVLPPGQ